MDKQIIDIPNLSDSNRRLGSPVSLLVKAGGMLYTCGIPPLDLATGDLIEGDITTQTRAVLEALKFTLETAGSSLDKVVKTMILCTDPDQMDAINAVYREYFTSNFPPEDLQRSKPGHFRSTLRSKPSRWRKAGVG